MAGLDDDVADQNAREIAAEALRDGPRQLPPPPSRAQYPSPPSSAYHISLPGGYASDARVNRISGPHRLPEPGSRTSVNPFGTPDTTQSPARSIQSLATESYADDPYQGFPATSSRLNDASLGVVNPHEIVDDGDDGLHYGRHSQRNSVLSMSPSERARQGVGPAGEAPGIGAAVAMGLAGLRSMFYITRAPRVLPLTHS